MRKLVKFTYIYQFLKLHTYHENYTLFTKFLPVFMYVLAYKTKYDIHKVTVLISKITHLSKDLHISYKKLSLFMCV